MINKIYLEITNVCNLDCSFCHKTKRKKQFMTEEEFDILTDKLSGRAKYLYFHLMGEPTLHPLFPKFVQIARQKGFLPMLTTNGSTLAQKSEMLLDSLPYKVSISLHAPEANPTFADENYLTNCIDFARKASQKGCYVALRLWNLGSDADNSEIIERLKKEFPDQWLPVRKGTGERLAERIFLEWGERFEWPDDTVSLPTSSTKEPEVFCYALRDHIGILVDGTAVPCCLDADGVLALGNLFHSEFEEIISSARAKAIFDGFSCRRAAEDFCKSCGFVKKFSLNS